MSALLACVTVAVAAACASRGSGAATAEGRRCTLRAADSLFMGDVPVFRECAVDRKARLTSRMIPLDHPQLTDVCHRAVIEFVVGTNGVAEVATARVVETNNDALAMALLESLPERRYDPALIDGLPVRQIVREERMMGRRRVVVQRATGSTVGASSVGAGGSPGPDLKSGC